jgi:hypothetical protein
MLRMMAQMREQLGQQMRERLGNRQAADLPLPEGLPSDVASLSETLQNKLREIEQRASGRVADNPLAPEILRLFGEVNSEVLGRIGSLLRRPDAEGKSGERGPGPGGG